MLGDAGQETCELGLHCVAAKLLAVVQQREQEPLYIAAFFEATVQPSKQDAGSKCPGICLHGSYADLSPETTEREGRALLGDVPFLHETTVDGVVRVFGDVPGVTRRQPNGCVHVTRLTPRLLTQAVKQA